MTTIAESMLTKLSAACLVVFVLSSSTAAFQAHHLVESAHGITAQGAASAIPTGVPAAVADAPGSRLTPGIAKMRRSTVVSQPLSGPAEDLVDLAGQVVVRPGGIVGGYSAPTTVLRI